MIEISFDVELDKNGMVDGMELAAQMIAIAGRLIIPYVRQCPGCLDGVFSHLANQELEMLHQFLQSGADGIGIVYCFPDIDENRDEIIQEALAASFPVVKDILQNQQDDGHRRH